MTEQPVFTPEDMDRHRCSYGCGRPFQFSITNVDDGTTEHLCLPDFVGLAMGIIQAAVANDMVDMSTMVVPGTAEPEVGYPGDDTANLIGRMLRVRDAEDGLDSADAYYTEEV